MELERGLSANSCIAYGGDLRLFAGYLRRRGRTRACEITRDDIGGFLREERIAGMKGSTRARRTAAVRMCLRYLKECRIIPSDPSELMDLPKKGVVLPKILGEAEVAAMLDAICATAPRDLRDRAILETLYGCGLRVSELCAVKTSDFMADGELLRVLGKGSKERVVPVGGAAGRAIVAYMESARGVFLRGNSAVTELFVTRLGRPFTRQGVFKIVRERAAAAGISAERISPHVLRHCFASHMLAHGADVRVLQELLGHADIGTTQIYTHVDVSRLVELHRLHPRH